MRNITTGRKCADGIGHILGHEDISEGVNLRHPAIRIGDVYMLLHSEIMVPRGWWCVKDFLEKIVFS